MKPLVQIFVLGALVAVLTSLTFAAVPPMINYQGKLATPSGALIVADTVTMEFKIYDDSTGGTILWQETQNSVKVEHGIFNVLLGSVNPIPDSVFNGNIRYLGVKVGDDPEITPRKPMVSVAYAYKSFEADTAEYARAGAGGDNDWVFPTSAGGTNPRPYLYTYGSWGIARFGNVLWGNNDSTHVNLGVACTTGNSGPYNKWCTVGGGLTNTASGGSATVGGGRSNTASGGSATVGGGSFNTASNDLATVGGGGENTASGERASVGGGFENTASGWCATVGGGVQNTASNYFATVGGGTNNTASGECATVAGGYWNTVAGDKSLAAGINVTLTSDADYTFAFGNGFTTSTPNAVIFYHSGSATRVGINKTDPSYALHLPNNADASGQGMANAWNAYSSIRWKENINPIDHALEKVLALRGVYFDWKESKKHGIGMIAEEVGKVIPEVVSHEENGVDAQAMDYARLTALLVEAIKEQQKEIEALKAKLEKLESNR
jgi:hypothetical protein